MTPVDVKVYVPGASNVEHTTVAGAFYEGICRTGGNVAVEIRPIDRYVPSDVAVLFGVGKKAVPISWLRQRIIDGQNRGTGQTIVLEKGYIKRDIYYAAGWGGLNGRADFCNKNSPGDRWYALDTWMNQIERRSCGVVLVCGQVPHDASVQHINYRHWVQSTLTELSEKLPEGVRAVFRPHPLAPGLVDPVPGVEFSTRSLEDDLLRAQMVVTYNSNTGVDAALAGIPVYAADIGSMVYTIASHTLDKLFIPRSSDQLQWAKDIAYAQWTIEEMKTGMPWRHLLRGRSSLHTRAQLP